MTIRQGSNIIAGRIAQCGFEIGDIGMSIFVDESKGMRRYLNGTTVAINRNTQGFLNRLRQVEERYPSIICTEEEWQSIATMSVFGQCGKFVIDETTGTIRLPRIVMPIQGLTDLTKLGEIVEQGLPNIRGDVGKNNGIGHVSNLSYGLGVQNTTTEGAFFPSKTCNFVATESQDRGTGGKSLGFDASRSSSIYKDGANVQQEQIQYPYFIQIATGQETSFEITNQVQLNNPHNLGDSKYSPQVLNNTSWLASNGQWNDGSVYKAFFEYYVSKIGENFGLGKIKNVSQSYNDYDLVIDSVNWQFRLPLLDGSEDLVSDKYDNLTLQASGSTYTAPANGYVIVHGYTGAGGGYSYIRGNAVEFTFNSPTQTYTRYFVPIKKSTVFIYEYQNFTTEGFRFIYAQGNGTLYYYVGETVQNANLIDAGRISEILSTKASLEQATSFSFPSNRYVDLTLGASGTNYTAPANGYVVLIGTTTSAGTCRLRNSSSGYALSNGDASQSFFINLSIPVKKNDNFNWERQGGAFNINVAIFRFIYAEGSN